MTTHQSPEVATVTIRPVHARSSAEAPGRHFSFDGFGAHILIVAHRFGLAPNSGNLLVIKISQIRAHWISDRCSRTQKRGKRIYAH